eukprot:2220209-Rhodomonas_salina.1
MPRTDTMYALPGLVEDCQLFSCTGANLHIETGADPIIHRCKIYESWSCGVRVTDKGKGSCIPCVVLRVQCATASNTRARIPGAKRNTES